MSENENEKNIGEIDCFVCGDRADVRQTRARGNHFYLSCRNCGTLQGQKQKMQQRIWDEATFFESSTVRRPNNVTDSGTKPVNEPVISPDNPKKLPETDPVSTKVESGFKSGFKPDFHPNDPDNEIEQIEQLPEKTGSNAGIWVAVLVGVGAIGAGLLT